MRERVKEYVERQKWGMVENGENTIPIMHHHNLEHVVFRYLE